MYFVYIIESKTAEKWCYGYSERPEGRLKEHNGNHDHYTGGKGPWILIFLRQFNEQKEAFAFERKLKKLRNKEFIKREFSKYFIKG